MNFKITLNFDRFGGKLSEGRVRVLGLLLK